MEQDQRISSFTSLKFPIWCLSAKREYVVVGGGGGPTKSGIGNAVSIQKWKDSNLSKFQELDLVSDAAMNIALHPEEDVIAFGVTRFLKLAKFSKESCEIVATHETVSSTRPSHSPSKLLDDEREQKKVVFDQEGKRLATADSEGSILVFQYPLSQNPGPLHALTAAHSAPIVDLVFDKNFLISTGDDSSVNVWDMDTGKLFERLSLPNQRPRTSRVLAGHLYVLSMVPRKPSRLQIFALARGLPRVKETSLVAGATQMDISPNGQWVAVGTSDGWLVLLDAQSLRVRYKARIHSFIISGLTFSPDSKEIVSVSLDRTLRCTRIEQLPKPRNLQLLFFVLVLLIALALGLLWQ